ncbi:hypothetical protein Scep_029285 [Stephania cephalantha]|uniref:Uncharacterized protein n=1 Tax=Stephania cephalantha TaxID=152367 RepID=A0AAP0HDE0_9MAGN
MSGMVRSEVAERRSRRGCAAAATAVMVSRQWRIGSGVNVQRWRRREGRQWRWGFGDPGDVEEDGAELEGCATADVQRRTRRASKAAT